MSRTVVAKRVLWSVGLLTLCSIALSGCAGGGAAVGKAGGPEVERYPDWVRVVPTDIPDATYYVGGCISAANVDEGIAAAKADAYDQMASWARDRFTDVFDEALLQSRTPTTSMDRFKFKSDGVEAYLDSLIKVSEVVDSYWRPCPDAPADGPVCDIFVLIKLRAGIEDSTLGTTLERFRERLRDEGNAGMAELAEYMQRIVGQPTTYE